MTTPTADTTAALDTDAVNFGWQATDVLPGVGHSPASEATAVQRLITDAGAALASGHDQEFLALFTQSAGMSAQRRYQAVKLLLEQGLGAVAHRQGQGLIELLMGLGAQVIETLEAEPAEPLLLNYAGVIFYELWGLEAARALFLAARRLDPELAHLGANLAAVHARRQDQTAHLSGRRRPQLHPALAGLSRRALRVSARAEPASGMRLSLCMIVKDEEEMLGRCLAAAAPAVDEIVIVDTGSTDRTIEIAHAYGARVIEREWTGSFAEARNVSFDAATGEWILYLDADEVLVADDVEKLRALCGHSWREAFFLHETNFTGHEEAGVAVVHSALRGFRNRPEYRFSGRLHEQIVHTLPTYLPERLIQSPVRIDHYGYLGSVRAAKEKSRRNVELLLTQRAEGGGTDAFSHFNLGSEYMALERFAAAAAEFEQAWALAQTSESPTAFFVSTLAGRLINALRLSGRLHEALTQAEAALAHYPDFTDIVYQQGLACLALGRHSEATAHLQRCMEMGDAPSRYTAIVGCGTFLPRLALAEWQLEQGDAGSALTQLRWCATNHPGFFGTYHPYTLALMKTGHSGRDAVAELESVLGDDITSMARFMIATALVEGGAAAEAAAQLGLVLARKPGNLPALELLCDTLLLQQDFAAFEAAVGDFARADLPAREKRERLAQMYLRHGFLRSAAREWMAVLDTRPDGAALRGLAEVARRNGQAEAAAAFAAQAVELDLSDSRYSH